MTKFSKFMCLGLSAVLFFGAFSAWAAGGKEGPGTGKVSLTAKYSDSDPPGGVRTDFMKNVWIKEVEKETGGQLKIQDFWGAALLSAPESLKGIADGVTNFGFVFPEFYPKQLPLHQVFKLFPRGPGKWTTIRWVYEKAYNEIPELKKEFEDQWGQKILVYTSGLPGGFASSKSLTKLQDIKGQKWRASSRWVLEYLKNAGAIPVSVPWADVFMALQTGTIDGVLTNYDGLHMMKFEEPAPNLMIAKEVWWATPFVHTVNKKFWDTLPKDVQDGVLKASATAMNEFDKAFNGAFDKIIDAQKKAGYKITFMSESDLTAWENEPELVKLQTKWVEETKAAGIANADAIMTKMRAIMKEAMIMDKK
jgi:TRAP-type C4-dicarboxylate transport system substrate-binding protein